MRPRNKEVKAMIKYCRCGEPIWVEHEFSGYHCVTKFYPATEEGPINPIEERFRISNCPSCGEFLFRSEDLLVEPPEDPDPTVTVESIAKDVLTLARERQDQASDLVASIHGVWQEVGLALAREMHRIREEERNRRNS